MHSDIALSLPLNPTISAESKSLPASAFKTPQVGAPSVDKGKVQGEPAKGNESSLLFSMFGV